MIYYTFDGEGKKLAMSINTPGANTEQYNGIITYQNHCIFQVAHEEGRLIPNPNPGGQYLYEYNYKDNVGNTRQTFADNNNDGYVDISEIRQEQHYYPFGLKMDGATTVGMTAPENERTYNGNKWQGNTLGLNLYDFNARQYNPYIGRFYGVDPLATATASITPMHFTKNNPIRYNDPTGLFTGDPMANGSFTKRIPNRGSGIYAHGLSMGFSSGIGPGSGNHWSDGYRSVLGNLNIMSTSTWQQFYGILDEYGNVDHEKQAKLASGMAAEQREARQAYLNSKAGRRRNPNTGPRPSEWNKTPNQDSGNANNLMACKDCGEDKPVVGPIGLGLNFEIGFPEWMGLESSGFGLAFGFVADYNGLGWYFTDKSTTDAVSFTLAPEFFFVMGVNGNIYMNDLDGSGKSFSGGFYYFGGEVGTNSVGPTEYYQVNISPVMSIGYGEWNNQTTITPIFYKK